MKSRAGNLGGTMRARIPGTSSQPPPGWGGAVRETLLQPQLPAAAAATAMPDFRKSRLAIDMHSLPGVLEINVQRFGGGTHLENRNSRRQHFSIARASVFWMPARSER